MSFLIHPNFWGLFYPLQSNHKYHIYITNHNQWSEDNKCRIESNFDVNTDPFFCILLLCYKQLPTNQLTLSHYFLQSAQIYNYTCVWWSVGLVMVGLSLCITASSLGHCTYNSHHRLSQDKKALVLLETDLKKIYLLHWAVLPQLSCITTQYILVQNTIGIFSITFSILYPVD